jgi:hypothetical protein
MKLYVDELGKKMNVCDFVGCNRQGCKNKEHIEECEAYLDSELKRLGSSVETVRNV